MAHRTDADIIDSTHNTARFFTERRSISVVLLIAVAAWGLYGYHSLPKRKDPAIPVRIAVASCTWPGATAMQVEQLITRPMEQQIAENRSIQMPEDGSSYGIKSLTLPGLAMMHIQLDDSVTDPEREFSDINLKLNSFNTSLPQGAGPIQFNSGVGETSAIMLTVASPKEDAVAIALRARDIRQAIQSVRSAVDQDSNDRASVVVAFPLTVQPELLVRMRDLVMQSLTQNDEIHDVRPIQGAGFVGFDAAVQTNDIQVLAGVEASIRDTLGVPRFHPDAWPPVVIRNPAGTEARLASVAGDKYTYRELDEMTDLIRRALQGVAQVSKVERSGVLQQQIVLEYSQEQLAAYNLQPSHLKQVLNARNITMPGGSISNDDMELLIFPTGAFVQAEEIGQVMIATTNDGVPVYLRDLVDIEPGYQNPPRFLNFYRWQDPHGRWQRSRAITLAAQMRPRQQIGEFGQGITQALETIRLSLPDDLIIARTSDQPRQVKESVALFMEALYEAIALVVLVALIGFWEWRSALLIALSIPLTLALTFGAVSLLGVQLQQVSIASLIIALGLLVDDPVVAGDAIKRELSAGQPREHAAWLGPTKLARAILFATVTNIVAYLPFLLLTGTTGDFVHSLPVVMTVTLIASRLVSMTFVPLLGYYLLRPQPERTQSLEQQRAYGVTGIYYRLGSAVLAHRWWALFVSFMLLGGGVIAVSHLKTSFFPTDVQYLSYIDIWLPNTASLAATNAVAVQAETIVEQVSQQYAKKQAGETGRVLESITSFVGGGGPRFWFTVTPELQQLNYAQLIVQVTDKDNTPQLAPLWQQALSSAVPGAFIEVHELETTPINYPVQIFVSDRADVDPQSQAETRSIHTLRTVADQIKEIFRTVPIAAQVRDDWGQDGLVSVLNINPDRANLAGLTNMDVATSAAAGLNGLEVTTWRTGDQQIPVVVRLRMEERAQAADVRNLYIYASADKSKVPLLDVASIEYEMQIQRIRRQDHFRTISVISFPAPGQLASSVLNAAWPELQKLQANLPPGLEIVIGGERARQQRGFRNLVLVLGVSVTAIFLALVIQFNSAVKPALVFAAVPYGTMGALVGLAIMGASFSFMAFLGIVSLVGVIVSHVIVLFDFIEENREKGIALDQSLLDAGVVRLRPVMITSGATILALFPIGHSWRAVVAAPMLCPDRRAGRGDLYRTVAGARAIRDLCPRFQADPVADGAGAGRRAGLRAAKRPGLLAADRVSWYAEYTAMMAIEEALCRTKI